MLVRAFGWKNDSINFLNINIMRKTNLLKTLLLLCALVAGSGSVWAEGVTIASATFNGKNATYTESWTTTGTGLSRPDCVIIGSGENITSPKFNLAGYSEVIITFTGRRYGTLSDSKATVDAAIASSSVGTIDITSTSVGSVSGSITFTPTSSMTNASIVFTCTNATSAGSTHGAGIGSITITGTVAKDLSSIAISGTYTTSFYTGDEFSSEGAVVTATYDDETTADVTSKATFTGYDMSEAGTQTVTVSYKEGDVTKTATYSITVNERPKFTVTLGDNDNKLTESEAGAGVTLPTRENVGNYVFKGWSTTELNTVTNTAPTIIEAGAYSPTANITLYPIYLLQNGKETTHSVNIGDYAEDNNWKTTDGEGQYYSVNVDDEVTVSVTESGNNGKVYTNSNIVNWRIYNKATLTITSTTDNIIGMTINTQDSGFGLKYGETTETRGTYFDVTPAKSVSLSATATARITVMDIKTSNAVFNYTSYPVVATISINSLCTDGSSFFGTYYTDEAYVMPEGVVGQTVTVADGVLNVADAYTAGAVVPAETALLLKAETAGDKEITLTTGGTAPASNMLKGTLTADETTTGDNCLFYRLTMHDGTKIGFWWGATEGAAFKPGANKAYLAVPKTSAARLGFSFDQESTGFDATLVNKEEMNKEVYDLQGRRVNSSRFTLHSSLKKGMYIVNGKKVIINK